MKTVFAAMLLLVPVVTFAQQKPPIANYRMSVETSAGMNMPGMGASGATGGMAGMIGGMMGGSRMQGGRTLRLDLESQRTVDAPSAAHEIPGSMNMGASLPLVTPQSVESRPVEVERQPYDTERGERPKGRLLTYWGCGEATRPGQPVVLDFATLGQGQVPPGYTGRTPPGSSSAAARRNTGHWPNAQDSKAVPDGASLIGEHTIRGNYTPDIKFALGSGYDFMDRITLTPALAASGAASVTWNAVSTATGYYATAFGSDGTDTVMWSSSEVHYKAGVGDYPAPAEVARLIRDKVVLSPQTTECTVPAEVVKKSKTPFVNLIAFGPEANFGFPPRPKDPEWYAKVRFKSTASALLGDGGSRGGGRTQQRAGQPAAEQGEQSAEQQPSTPSGPSIPSPGNILRGIFGR